MKLNFPQMIGLLKMKVFVYGILGTLAGFFMAGSLTSLKAFIFSVIGGGLALVFSASAVAESKVVRATEASQGTLYIISICVLFSLCWFTATIVSAGAEPGDEDGFGNVATFYIPPKPCAEEKGIYLSMFMALVAPTLVGVKLALPERHTEEGSK